MSNYEKVQEAISYISPDIERDAWVKIGMAVKSELGQDGFAIFDNWSKGGKSYNERDVKDTWKSISGSQGITVGTLFHEARLNGYQSNTTYTPPSPEEIAQREERARIEAAQKETDAQAARKTAEYRWNNGQPADLNHPYLVKKGITNPSEIHQYQSFLQIPIYDKDGKIQSMQSINAEGGKFMLKGGTVKGGSMVIGDISKPENGVILCEGYATGKSLNNTTGLPVIVAFNSANLVAVADIYKNKLPANTPWIIAADNDLENRQNAGVIKAEEAAGRIGSNATVMLPPHDETAYQSFRAETGNLPTDFNDIERIMGANAIRAALAKATLRIQQQRAAQQLAEQQNVSKEMLDDDIKPAQETIEDSQINKIERDDNPVQRNTQNMDLQDSDALLENDKHYAMEQAISDSDIREQIRNDEIPDTMQEKADKEFALKNDPLMAQEQAAIENDMKKQQAAMQQQAAATTSITIPNNVKKQYLASSDGTRYFDRDNQLAITLVKEKQLRTAKSDKHTISNMIAIAQASKWTQIKVKGTPEFRREAWLQGSIMGIQVKGYSPTKLEKELMQARRTEYNTEQSHKQARTNEATVKASPPQQRSQKSGNTEKSIKKESQRAEGELIAFGVAPYKHDKNNNLSYYATVRNENGTQTVWGVGLRDALKARQAKLGDTVTLESQGFKSKTITVPVKNNLGRTVGEEEKTVRRNEWEVKVTQEKKAQEKKPLTEAQRSFAEEKYKALLSQTLTQQANQKATVTVYSQYGVNQNAPTSIALPTKEKYTQKQS